MQLESEDILKIPAEPVAGMIFLMLPNLYLVII